MLTATDFTLAGAAQASRQLLDLAERPTAIWFASDDLALGGLRVIKDRGLRIPADMSVAGFNDIPYAAIAVPPLTTVRMPAETLGTVAMQMLVALIDRPGPVRDLTFNPELVMRDSAAPPRANIG